MIAPDRIWVGYPVQPKRLEGSGCRLAYVWDRGIESANGYLRATPELLALETENAKLRAQLQLAKDALSGLFSGDITYDGPNIIIECVDHADAMARGIKALSALASLEK